MSTDRPTHATDMPRTNDDASAAGKLSQAVFANPQDFLSTLQSILPSVNPASDDVSKSELINYSISGDNARDRAAAAIAANHFDQLRQMPTTFEVDYDKEGRYGLNQAEVGIDLDMASGNLQAPIQKHLSEDADNGIPEAILAVSLGIGTVAALETPPLAAIAAVSAGTFGVGALFFGTDAATVQLRAQWQSSHDRSILASWPEINNGHNNAAK